MGYCPASRAVLYYKDLLGSEIAVLQRKSDGVRLAAAWCKEVLEEFLGCTTLQRHRWGRGRRRRW